MMMMMDGKHLLMQLFAKLSCIIHALDEACSHIKNGQAWLAETFEYRDVDLLVEKISRFRGARRPEFDSVQFHIKIHNDDEDLLL